MLLTQAKKILVVNGFEVKECKYFKNGIEVTGLTVMLPGDNIGVSIPESTINTVDTNDPNLLVRLINGALDNKDRVYGIQDKLSKEFILAKVRSCVQSISADNIPKTYVKGDLEEYYRIIEDDYSIRVTYEMIDKFNISEAELRCHARQNLKDLMVIKSMTETLLEMMTPEQAEIMGINDMLLDQPAMYVATTEDKKYGAGIIALDDVIDRFACDHEVDRVAIIPSSIHEVILITNFGNEVEVASDLDQMISEVNDTEVDIYDKLSNHAYFYYC